MSGERRGTSWSWTTTIGCAGCCRYLTEHGYHVSTAADADEAKASLKNFAFDMMVLDVMLPGQNGISLTSELRTRSTCRSCC